MVAYKKEEAHEKKTLHAREGDRNNKTK